MPATGIISTPTRLLAELVASAPTFQTAVGAVDEDAALVYSYEVSVRGSQLPDLGDNASLPTLYAVSGIPKNQRIGRGSFGPGEMLLIFEQLAPEGYERGTLDDSELDNSDGSLEFRNTVGAIIEEMMDETENGAATKDRLLVREIIPVANLMRSDGKDPRDYFQATYTVLYGAVR